MIFLSLSRLLKWCLYTIVYAYHLKQFPGLHAVLSTLALLVKPSLLSISQSQLCRETLAPHPSPASGDLDLLGPCELTTPGTSQMTTDGIWLLRLTCGIRQASSRFICLFSALVVVS